MFVITLLAISFDFIKRDLFFSFQITSDSTEWTGHLLESQKHPVVDSRDYMQKFKITSRRHKTVTAKPFKCFLTFRYRSRTSNRSLSSRNRLSFFPIATNL